MRHESESGLAVAINQHVHRSSLFRISHDFGLILRGLVANRRLTPQAMSRASGRAESTIRQLLSGAIPPRVEVLQDIAPAMQLPVADLLVIAGLPVDDVPPKVNAT